MRRGLYDEAVLVVEAAAAVFVCSLGGLCDTDTIRAIRVNRQRPTTCDIANRNPRQEVVSSWRRNDDKSRRGTRVAAKKNKPTVAYADSGADTWASKYYATH